MEVILSSPATGISGDAVTITGNGFGARNVRVTVGGIAAQILHATGHVVTFRLPHGLRPGPTMVTATNPGGHVGSIPFEIRNRLPLAHGGIDRTVFVGTTVQLDGSGSTDPDGQELSFRWSFVSTPAGSRAAFDDPAAVRPSFLVDRPGTFVIQLVVNDGLTDSGPDLVVIDTQNSPPVAHAGTDQTVFVGDPVHLDGTASSDVDGDSLNFSWRLITRPDGSHAALIGADSDRPMFSVDLPGRYVVELVVNDGKLDSRPDVVVIDTMNSRPVANAGADQTVVFGGPVRLDGTASTDIDGDPLRFAWSFVSRPAGSAVTIVDAESSRPSFVPDVIGLYVVQLGVSDGTLESEADTVAITVDPATPTLIRLEVAPAPTAVIARGQRLGFTARGILSDGSISEPLTSVLWRSDTPAVAKIDQAGIATGVGIGVAAIRASAEGIESAATLLTVTSPRATTLAISPLAPAMRVGESLQFRASATLTDGSVADVTTTVSWSSGDTRVIAVSVDGVATARAEGSTSITADHPDGLSAHAPVTVLPPLPPVIAGFTPTAGRVGDRITITGAGFVQPPSVIFGSAQAVEIVDVSPTSFVAIVPSGATTGPIAVSTSGGTASSLGHFVVLTNSDFTLLAAPAQSMTLQGARVNYDLRIEGAGGFTGLVAISVVGLPGGARAELSTPTLAPGQRADLTIATSATSPVGAFTVTVTAVADTDTGRRTRSVSLGLEVVAGGTTSLTGQVLMVDGTPVPNVRLRLDTVESVTDASGRFLLAGVPAGLQQLMIDANAAQPGFPIYAIDVTLASGSTTVVAPFRITPPPPPDRFVALDNASADQVITDPRFPGVEITLPAGVTIVGWDGTPKTKVAIERLAPDALPVPPPPSLTRSLYQLFFGTPMGGIPSAPLPVTLPNDLGMASGGKAELWYYDASPLGGAASWRLAGLGTVSPDGSRIVSDPGVGIQRFCGVCGIACFVSQQETQPNNEPGGPDEGDPVNLAIGRFIATATDIVLPGRLPLILSRMHNPFDPFDGIAGFRSGLGQGWWLSVDVALLEINSSLVRVVLPGNSRFDFTRQPDGTFRNAGHYLFSGAVLVLGGDGDYRLRFKRGRSWRFTRLAAIPGLQLLAETSDRSGNRIAIDRNTAGFPLRIVEPSGRAVTIRVEGGRVQALVDPIGREVRYAYGSDGHLESVTDFGGGVTRYTYDSGGRLLTVTSPRGATILRNEYSPGSGRVLRQIQADGGVWSFRYRLQGATVTGQGCPGAPCPTEESADRIADGYVFRGGTVVATTATDPRGGARTYRLAASGLAVEAIDPLGEPTRFERDAAGRLLVATDPLGRTMRFAYDEIGNLTSVTDAAGHVRSVTYEPTFSLPTGIVDALGNVTTFEYSVTGDLVAIVDAEQNRRPASERLRTRFEYNAYGQPVQKTDPAGNTTRLAYNAHGDLVSITDAEGTITRFDYDAVSRRVRHTDGRGGVTRFVHDALDRMISVIDPVGGVIHREYDAHGNVVSRVDPIGNRTTHEYDAMDRVTVVRDSRGGSRTMRYDLSGNLIELVDANGQRGAFVYDTLNRLVGTEPSDGASQALTYDAGGRLVRIDDTADPVRPIIRTFDENDRLAVETTGLGTVIYEYDALGRRTRMTVSGQAPVVYAYDALSRLHRIAQGEPAVTFEYDSTGRRLLSTLPNGMSTTYVRDSVGRVRQMRILNVVGASEDLSYDYDGNGNPIRVAGSLAGVLVPDAITSSSYEAGNRQIGFGDRRMAFDGNGNVVSITDRSGALAFVWDARNRLIHATGPSGNASFQYDALGRRVWKTINGATAEYRYDLREVVAEHGAAVTATYLRGPRVDEPILRRSTIGEYYHADPLGNVLALSDDEGAIRTRYRYLPFGGAIETATTSSNPFQYTGRENDGVGLYYYRARYYAPSLRRFLSPDPRAESPDHYVYARNSPLRYRDPLGLEDEEYPGAQDAAEDAAEAVIDLVLGEAGGFGAATTIGGTILDLGDAAIHMGKGIKIIREHQRATCEAWGAFAPPFCRNR